MRLAQRIANGAMEMRRWAAILVAMPLALGGAACSKPKSDGATTSESPGGPANATDAASAASRPTAATPTPSSTETWRGTYTSVPGTLYIPRGSDVPNAKDWDGVKFRGDDAGIGRGDGKLEVAINRSTGVLEGTGEGVAGPIRVYGRVFGNTFAATVARKDPSDMGLTGTLTGTLDGAQAKGVMKLAESNAVALRDVTFTLTKEP